MMHFYFVTLNFFPKFSNEFSHISVVAVVKVSFTHMDKGSGEGSF